MSPIAAALCASLALLSVGDEKYPLPMSRVAFACDNMEALVDAAEEYLIPPTMMVAIIYYESMWIMDDASHKGACGLMQTIPRWLPWHDFTCQELETDATKAFIAGASALRHWRVEKPKEVPNLEIALRCYNAGNIGMKGVGAGYARRVLRYKGEMDKLMEAYRSGEVRDAFQEGVHLASLAR